MEKELGDYLTASIDFYSDDTNCITTKYYMIGKKLTASDLPDENDSIIASAKPGYKVVGWQVKNPTEIPADSYTTNRINSVDTLTVTNKRLQLQTTWAPKTDTPYTINYYLENIEDSDYTFYKNDKRKGETDSLIDLSVLPDMEHFTLDTATLPSGVTISGYGDTEIDVYYTRNEYTVSFWLSLDNPYSTYESSENQFTGKYGAKIESVLSDWPTATWPGYRHYGWYRGDSDKVCTSYDEALEIMESKIPETFTEDIIYYPVWGPETYKVTVRDQFGKKQSFDLLGSGGNPFDSDDSCIWSTGDEFVLSFASVNNGVDFENIYINDESCSDSSKVLLPKLPSVYSLKRSDITGDVTLYAKWKYTKIYVDPEKGDDNNNGKSSATALKTIEEALKYNVTGSIQLCSALTNPDDIKNLNNLPVSISRYVNTGDFTFPYIYIKSGTELAEVNKLSNITLDGGAVWSEDVANGTYLFTVDKDNRTIKKINSGKKSTAPLIINEGTMYIGGNVVLQNNDSTTAGGAIYNTGSLYINGNNTTEIKDNYSADCGGAIYCTENGPSAFNELIIKNNSVQKNGGALYFSLANVENQTEMNSLRVESNRSENSGGGIYSTRSNVSKKADLIINNSYVENNYAGGSNVSGGGMYNYYCWVVFTDCYINNNECTGNGGGITVSLNSKVFFNSTLIENNNAQKNGGGISCSGGGNVTYNSGTVISGNTAGGIGQGGYFANVTATLNGGYFDNNNDVGLNLSASTKPVIKIASDSIVDSSLYDANDNVILTFTPDSYITTYQIIRKDTGVTKDIESLFKVIDSSDGKKWKINNGGYLEEVIESSEAGGGITNPFNTSVLFAIDETSTSNNSGSAWYIKAIVDGTVEIDANNICNSFEDLTIKLYMNGSYVNIENSPSSASVPKPIFPSGYDTSADSFSLEITGRYKTNGRLYTNTIEVTM